MIRSLKICFRPQQGLTIMNDKESEWIDEEVKESFRPQQGLTIMNYCK